MSENKAESSESQVFNSNFIYCKRKPNMSNRIVLQDFIVFYSFIISVHFRYIYSTNVINGQGVVRGV